MPPSSPKRATRTFALRPCGAYVADALAERLAGREGPVHRPRGPEHRPCEIGGKDLSRWLGGARSEYDRTRVSCRRLGGYHRLRHQHIPVHPSSGGAFWVSFGGGADRGAMPRESGPIAVAIGAGAHRSFATGAVRATLPDLNGSSSAPCSRRCVTPVHPRSTGIP